MESVGKSSSSVVESPVRRWSRTLRPLALWVILVVILFGIRTHERLMERTRLEFTVSLEGRPAEDADVRFDNGRISSGEKIPLGRHRFTVWHPKAEPFSTNLFIWYGGIDFGDIALSRSKGTLTVKANPSGALLTIQGPEFSLSLTNSPGVSTTLPTDHYSVAVSNAHWQDAREITVSSEGAGVVEFEPRLGAVQLTCNQSEASFQVYKTDGQLLEAGDLPAWIVEVPEGTYNVVSWHHKNKKEQVFAVQAGITNSVQLEFTYGAALLETEPPGAAVMTLGGQECGKTPLLFSELPTGKWKFQLRLAGYSPVHLVLDVAAQQTNNFNTNLVSINYEPAITAARQHFSAGDYDAAVAATAEALQVKPNDPEALALQNEALYKGHVRQAESLGKRGDYIDADKELEIALESLPDNEEAKQLLADFRTRELEQRDRLREERLARGKKLFDSVLSRISDSDLFESHELTIDMPVKEVQTRILDALKIHPEFRVTRSVSDIPETFEIEAVQELKTVLSTSAGRRQGIFVGARTKDEETQILFKVLEYKTEGANKVLLGALLNTPVELKYIPVHPSRIPNFTDKLKAQVEEGVKMVADRIQQAIAGTESK
jgi:tetratricopeptide (TPR) repeat protein